MRKSRKPQKPRIEPYQSFEQFYNFDPTNPIDQLIQQKVQASLTRNCAKEYLMIRKILAKRLQTGICPTLSSVKIADHKIELAIQSRIKNYNIDRDTLVRNQFIVHFNIKQ